jgi:aspartate kinase
MIVMKFGGTSVEDEHAIRKVTEIVGDRAAESPVVVVSAMAGITDQLVAMGRAAAQGDRAAATHLLEQARERHRQTGLQLAGGSVRQSLQTKLDVHFEALARLLDKIATVGSLSPRSSDALLSFGELLSTELVNAAFRAAGLASVVVDSRECMVTNLAHTRAVPDFAQSKHRLEAKILPAVHSGRILVMGGFIAATADGIPTTLGRGGSDFSAAIIGAALGVECIEIWTDVPGIMTTDPGICSDARLIPAMSFAEAAEMAYFGAKVLHPGTLVPAAEHNIPVLVLNSRDPGGSGTRIESEAPTNGTTFRAITARRNVNIVNVGLRKLWSTRGFMRSVFTIFDRHNCPVDAVSTTQGSVSLAVDSAQMVPSMLTDLHSIAEVSCEDSKAIVCLVGENIRGKPGIAARVFGTVARGGINVRMISQGASEISISFVIEEKDAVEAVRRLHTEFFGGAAERDAAWLGYQRFGSSPVYAGELQTEPLEEDR